MKFGLHWIIVWIYLGCLLQISDGQAPVYFNGPGNFTYNSCPVSACRACSGGYYLQGCGGTQQGTCTPCSATLPANAHWTPPAYSDNCLFACDAAYTLSNGQCVVGSNSGYAIALSISLPQTAAQVISSLGALVSTFSSLIGCGTCGDPTLTPVVCTSCKIYLTIQQISAVRRLLVPSTAVSVQIVQTQQSQASTAAAALTQTNINNQLASSGLPPATVISAASITVVLLNSPTTVPAVTTGQPQPTTAAPTTAAPATAAPTTAAPTPQPTAPPATLPPVPSPAPSSGGDSGNGNMTTIIGVVVAVVALILIGVIIYFVMHKSHVTVASQGLATPFRGGP